MGKKAIYKLDFEYVLKLLQQHKSESSLTPKDKKSKTPTTTYYQKNGLLFLIHRKYYGRISLTSRIVYYFNFSKYVSDIIS